MKVLLEFCPGLKTRIPMHTHNGNTREQQAAPSTRSSTAPPHATGSERLRPAGSSSGLRVFALVGLVGFALLALKGESPFAAELMSVNLILGACVLLEVLAPTPAHIRIRNQQSNP